MNWNQLLCSERVGVYQSNNKNINSRDLRNEFEKDYHRIIGSAAFRRLQDKTQVFPLDKNDYIRTRLTHSLEVSSFAKSLGQNVGEMIIEKDLDKDFGINQKQYICDILQAAGLIHDIGNPPFGHFGEDAIRNWFKNNISKLSFKGISLDKYFDINDDLDRQMLEDFYNFEGNTQALRVVSKLHFFINEYGMNLTKALLSTIIKYPVSSVEIDKKSGNIKTKKMGYYYAEKELFEDIQISTGTNNSRHPLTFLLESADDIAYRTADIEDSIKKGCLSYDQLISELKLEETYKDESSVYYKVIDKLESKYKYAVKNDIENPGMFAVQYWTSACVQGTLLYAASDNFITHYNEIMSGTYTYDLFHGIPEEKILDNLGRIADKYSFKSSSIYKLEIAADNLFNFLLDRFVSSVINYDTDEVMSPVAERVVSLISDDYRKIYEIYSKGKSEKEKLYLRLLMATDYVSGMTDSFAKNLYQEFNGIM